MGSSSHLTKRYFFCTLDGGHLLFLYHFSFLPLPMSPFGMPGNWPNSMSKSYAIVQHGQLSMQTYVPGSWANMEVQPRASAKADRKWDSTSTVSRSERRSYHNKLQYNLSLFWENLSGSLRLECHPAATGFYCRTSSINVDEAELLVQKEFLHSSHRMPPVSSNL